MSKKLRKKKKFTHKPKKDSNQSNPSGVINLNTVTDTADWKTLADIFKDTLSNTIQQCGLVVELRKKNESKLTEELTQAFDGLELSFKDLIKETLNLGLRHSTETEFRTDEEGVEHEFPVMLKTGLIKADMDDDASMEYLNIASSYMNIQDKTINLVSLGWVDLFTRLKMPLDDVTEIIKDGINKVKSLDEELIKEAE